MLIDYTERETKPHHIEYWYDRSQKVWVIQVIAEDGFEYTDGDYELRDHTCHGSVKDKVIADYINEYGVPAIRV